MMDPMLIRILAFVIGLLLLFLVVRSFVYVAMMNRHHNDVLARLALRPVRRVAGVLTRGARGLKGKQQVLVWCYPSYLLSLIVVYFASAMTGFALLYWAMRAVPTWGEAFIASGSALSTLGFATPSTTAGRWAAIPEGAFGLGIVVYLFTFIPTVQAVLLSREDRTAWLYDRVGDPPTGPKFLEWCSRDVTGEMSGMWEAWESWFRALADTHSISPILTMTPSVRTGQSWLVAAAAVLDATSITISTIAMQNPEPARLCARAGVSALRAVAAALGQKGEGSGPTGGSITRGAYDAACMRLTAAGMRLRPDREVAWREFVRLRSQYEDALIFIARQTFVPFDAAFFDGGQPRNS